jgi:Ca2+-binding EF-hand superfamily protein
MNAGAELSSGADEIEASRRALQAELKAAGAHIDEVGRSKGAQARMEKIAEDAAAHSAQLSFAAFQQHQRQAKKAGRASAKTLAGDSGSAGSGYPTIVLDKLKESETEAKRRIAELQRQLDQKRIKARMSEVERRNLAVGEAIRAHARNDRLKQILEGATPASEEEMRVLSESFNESMCDLLEESTTPESWVKLFRLVDADGSGQISFDELCLMAREELGLLPADIADEQLKAIWLYLDSDQNGFISTGEFGNFMRKGAHVLIKHKESWRERLEARNHAAADNLRANRDRLLERDMVRRLEGAIAAPEGDVALLARLCQQRMSAVNEEDEAPSRSWYNLFKRVDEDDSGRVTFAEFRRLVRAELGVPTADMEEVKLKGVWLALDSDQNGFITAAEFAAFMRKAEPQAKDQRLRNLLARRRKAEAGKQHDEQIKLAAKEMIRQAVERKRENVRQAREENQLRRKEDAAKREAASKEAAELIRANSRMDFLTTELVGVPSASEAEVRELSEACNARMLELVGYDEKKAAWFKFYRRVDSDDSGRIDFKEFRHMLRVELQLSAKVMDDYRLKTAWVALDVDSSGYISAGEFGSFMRRGERVLNEAKEERPWKERRLERAKAAHAARLAERDALFHRDIAKQLEGAPPASDEEVRRLSEAFNARLQLLEAENELQRQATSGARSDPGGSGALSDGLDADGLPPMPAAARSCGWYTLFKHVDENESGTISYRELKVIVRDELQLTPKDVPEHELQAVYLALDKDKSGFITAGEFGQFMRLGAPDRVQGYKKGAMLERRRAIALRERAIFEMGAAQVHRRHAEQLARQKQEYDRRVQVLERELQEMEGAGDTGGGASGSHDPARVSVEPVPSVPSGEELSRQRRLTMAKLRGAPPPPSSPASGLLSAYASKSTPILPASQRNRTARAGRDRGAASEGKLKLPAIQSR